jgi:hypothetical protein
VRACACVRACVRACVCVCSQRHLNSWMTLRQYRLGAYSSAPVKLRCEACEVNAHKLSQRQKQVDFGKSKRESAPQPCLRCSSLRAPDPSLSVCLPVNLPVCLPACLCVCVSVCQTPSVTSATYSTYLISRRGAGPLSSTHQTSRPSARSERLTVRSGPGVVSCTPGTTSHRRPAPRTPPPPPLVVVVALEGSKAGRRRWTRMAGVRDMHLLLRHMLKMIVLPRQARDRRRESTEKERCVYRRGCSSVVCD